MTNKYVAKQIAPFIRSRLTFTCVTRSFKKDMKKIKEEKEEAKR